MYTETLLAKSLDPRRPKSCQFVDLTGVSLKQGLHAKLLRKLYGTFEPNYPETLEKMVMYPVPKIMVSYMDLYVKMPHFSFLIQNLHCIHLYCIRNRHQQLMQCLALLMRTPEINSLSQMTWLLYVKS